MAERSEHEIVIKGKDEYTKTVDQAGRKVEGLSNKVKLLGAAMMAAGTAGILMMGSFVKAAAAEEAGITRLQMAMKNVGLSYDESREKLEAWIDANQQATSFADTEQRSALASLVRVTRDLTEAQNLLTLAMDMSVGTGRDLESSTTTLMYAIGGNWGMVERLIPALKQVQAEEEKWRLLHELFAGQAVEFGGTMAGQFKTLENNVSDLKEAMGAALLPVVKSLLEPVKKFVGFMKEHPELTKFAAGAITVGSGLLVIQGAAMLLSTTISRTLIPAMGRLVTFIWIKVIPALTAKLSMLLATLAAMGPAGWAMLAVATATIVGLAVAVPKLLESLTAPKTPPKMDTPGRVPGPYGALVPVIARGGEYFGGFPPRGAPGGVTVNLHVGAMLGNEEDARQFTRLIRDQLEQEYRR